MDILLANTPAIILGMTFIRKGGFLEYDWLGRKGKKYISDWEAFKREYNSDMQGLNAAFKDLSNDNVK